MTAGQKRLMVVLGSVMAVAVGLRTTGVTLRAQTAWESYKNRKYPPSVDKHLTDPALIGAIDLHAHSDPDSYPRSWDGFEVAKLAQERGMRGVVLKNHWTETAGLAYLARKYATPGFEVFGARVARHPGRRSESAGGAVHGRRRRPSGTHRLDADPRLRARSREKSGRQEPPVRHRVAQRTAPARGARNALGHRSERSDAGDRPRDAGRGVPDHAGSEEARCPADDRHAPDCSVSAAR